MQCKLRMFGIPLEGAENVFVVMIPYTRTLHYMIPNLKVNISLYVFTGFGSVLLLT